MNASLPLSGLTVLVTRAPEQAGELSEFLKQAGAGVIELPVISIQPPESWDPVDEALKAISQYDWIIFASANAVRFFLQRMDDLSVRNDQLTKVQIAAVGTATAELLNGRGLKVHFCPSKFVAECLVDEFPGYPNLRGIKILWPRTNIGRTYISDELRRAGARVDSITVYRTTEPPDKDRLAADLAGILINKKVQIVTLASAQSAQNLASLLGFSGASLEGIMIASIGPETTASAIKHLGRIDIEAPVHTMPGLVAAICDHFAPRADIFNG